MKITKSLSAVLAAVLCLSLLSACGGEAGHSDSVPRGQSVSDILNQPGTAETEEASTEAKTPGGAEDRGVYDVDLTALSSTMVYSEVYNMMSSPDQYLGKTVKMHGTFLYTEGSGRYYFACLIRDATACCAQGFEFVLKDERVFPDEYPKAEEEITVAGVFDTYYEGQYRYCQLIDAVLL